MKKSIMIPVLVLLLSQFVFAQNPEWIHYRTNNSGLPGNLVGSLAIESDSNDKQNIWIGTGLSTPGITKFDGQNWIYYDSSFFGFSFSAVSIRIDSQKNLWIGSNKGLVKFYNNNWTIFDTNNSDIPTNFALYLHVTKGDTILIGSPAYNKWYFEFDGVNSWKIIDPILFPSQMDVSNVSYEISTGKRWISNRRFIGAVLYDGENFSVYSTTNSGISSNEILGLAIDQNNNKYFGPDFALGISKLDSSNSIWSVYGFGNYAARDIVIDKNGNIWWISRGIQALGGLFKANEDFSIVTVWNANNSPLNSDPLCIAIDSNDNKWIGCNNGLFVFNESGIVNIGDDNINVPESFMLYQNSPNPFNPQTLIRLDVTQSQHAKLKIYNSIGQHVSTLVDRTLSPGKYEFLWDGMGFTSGIYFYTLEIDNKIQTRKMILLK